MINYLEWYKRDIKINRKRKSYTLEYISWEQESVVFLDGSSSCLEELQIQKAHAHRGEDAGMLHRQENQETDLPHLHLRNCDFTTKLFYREE